MDKQEFVEKITSVVRDAGVADCLALLTAPPGRKPPQWLQELAHWFNLLSAPDKEMVQRIIKFSLDTGVFGFFCVLDGDRTIAETNEEAHLTLLFSNGNSEVKLNDGGSDGLHDIFMARDS